MCFITVYIYCISTYVCSLFRENVFVYIAVPSCYATTNCTGEPINSSITYSDCCMNFGVSYDLDGQCQPCPTTSMYSQVCCTDVIVIDSTYLCI